MSDAVPGVPRRLAKDLHRAGGVGRAAGERVVISGSGRYGRAHMAGGIWRAKDFWPGNANEPSDRSKITRSSRSRSGRKISAAGLQLDDSRASARSSPSRSYRDRQPTTERALPAP